MTSKKISDQDKTSRLVEVARLYYEHRFSQQQIAVKLKISRPGVSRLLQQARDEGIVCIEIRDPTARGILLEETLRERFGLKRVMVVPSDGQGGAELLGRLGATAARYLDEIVHVGLVLGVSWGTTMQEVTRHLRPKPIEEMTVVQLNGGISKADYDTRASDVVQRTGASYAASPYLLPLPAVVDHADLKRAIISDKNIARTLELARSAEAALFTVGAFNHESVLVKADYFGPREVQHLLRQGAVGDICSRIIDSRGKICWPELDGRTIGIELRDLSLKPYAIAVAGGVEKLKAIRAGLEGKHFNVLITDEWVAGELVRAG